MWQPCCTYGLIQDLSLVQWDIGLTCYMMLGFSTWGAVWLYRRLRHVHVPLPPRQQQPVATEENTDLFYSAL